MFGLSLTLLSACAMFAVATCATPGPNNAMMLSSGVNFGFKRTLPHILGVFLGCLFIFLLAAVGLQQWLFKFFWVQFTLKWAGASYMLYLAYCIYRTEATSIQTVYQSQPFTFFQAALFQWVNPKLWASVLGYYGAYVPAEASIMQSILLSFFYILVGFPFGFIWTYAGVKLRAWLQEDKRLTYFNRSMGCLLALSIVAALLTE
jgi:threonine/homoserine/homoserine lactone efflux protein